VRTRLFEIVPSWIRSDKWLPQRFEARLRDEAERATAQVGVALARYRLAHGSWPERLEALVPAELAQIPSDPFDGAQLRYRPRADGALVYSVGGDLKDDGGAPVADGGKGGDVVFSVRLRADAPLGHSQVP
jgi:type II secretory pathway pseudopilin PulG